MAAQPNQGAQWVRLYLAQPDLASRKYFVVEPRLAFTLVSCYNCKSQWRGFVRTHIRCTLVYVDELSCPQGHNRSAGVGQSPISFGCPQVLMWSLSVRTVGAPLLASISSRIVESLCSSLSGAK